MSLEVSVLLNRSISIPRQTPRESVARRRRVVKLLRRADAEVGEEEEREERGGLEGEEEGGRSLLVSDGCEGYK